MARHARLILDSSFIRRVWLADLNGLVGALESLLPETGSLPPEPEDSS